MSLRRREGTAVDASAERLTSMGARDATDVKLTVMEESGQINTYVGQDEILHELEKRLALNEDGRRPLYPFAPYQISTARLPKGEQWIALSFKESAPNDGSASLTYDGSEIVTKCDSNPRRARGMARLQDRGDAIQGWEIAPEVREFVMHCLDLMRAHMDARFHVPDPPETDAAFVVRVDFVDVDQLLVVRNEEEMQGFWSSLVPWVRKGWKPTVALTLRSLDVPKRTFKDREYTLHRLKIRFDETNPPVESTWMFDASRTMRITREPLNSVVGRHRGLAGAFLSGASWVLRVTTGVPSRSSAFLLDDYESDEEEEEDVAP